MSPALACGIFTTGSPGKSLNTVFFIFHVSEIIMFFVFIYIVTKSRDFSFDMA